METALRLLGTLLVVDDRRFLYSVGDVKESCASATTNFVHLRGRGGADGLTKFQAKAG